MKSPKINLVNFGNIDFEITSIKVEEVKLPFNVTPLEFLEFAKEDMKEKSKRGYVNCATNVKRAVEAELDAILYSNGLFNTSDQESWKFPNKIEQLKLIGINIQNIINIPNEIRVELEHRYRLPPKNEVSKALQIAELFVDSTKDHYLLGIKELNDSKSSIDIDINRDSEMFIISSKDGVMGDLNSRNRTKYYEFLNFINQSIRPFIRERGLKEITL